jgi:acyl carrier protein
MTTEIAPRVRAFIEDNFLFRADQEGIGASESLLEAGLIDSTGILELVSFLETEFALQMADDEIVPENLDSIDAISAYVAGKTAGTGQADAA